MPGTLPKRGEVEPEEAEFGSGPTFDPRFARAKTGIGPRGGASVEVAIIRLLYSNSVAAQVGVLPYTAALQANSQPVALERIPASADSNTATKQTIEAMCRYISESAKDPVVRDAARYLRANFAKGEEPAMLAWSVFWFVKHNLKFVVDEAPLMRFERVAPGSGFGQQDMLISPAVLLRMSPWERNGDCDDFTMLVCSLLKCLGVPFVIVTICADPSDPSRWSHVFPMALTPAAIALDASHGSGPGWMVPASHTFKWQAWDENAKPVYVGRPQNGLHGWTRSNYGLGNVGMGQTTSGLENMPLESSGSLVLSGDNSLSQLTTEELNAGATTPTTTPATTTPVSSSSGFNWTSFLNTLTTQAAGVAKTAELSSLYQNTALETSGALQSLIPIVVVVVIGGLALSMLSKK